MTSAHEASTSPLANDLGHDRYENRRALIRLVVVFALGVALAIVFNAIPVLIVVLAIVFIVMAHEFGHFVTAKASGMKVTEYFLGFGPRLWSVRRGETEYGIKALPAGGYVRIVGMTMLEEVDPKDEARSYREATFPRRLLVAVAGSAMHFVMALVLLWSIFAFSGIPMAATAQITGLTKFANSTSPAKLAGFKANDVFVAIDGHRFGQAQQFVNFIRSHPNQGLAVIVRRGTRDITLHVRPVDGRRVDVAAGTRTVPLLPRSSAPTGVIGVEYAFLSKDVTANPFVSIGRAVMMLGSVTKLTALGIGSLFSPHGLAQSVHQVATAGTNATASTGSGASASNSNPPELLSIVGAIQIGAQAARQNISELLYILVAINIFIGMVNMFPMLPLDGGHVAIAVYERIRTPAEVAGYHADITKLMPVAYLFLAFVVILGLSALYVNIVQPATLPGG